MAQKPTQPTDDAAPMSRPTDGTPDTAAGPLAQLIARQAEVYAEDEKYEEKYYVERENYGNFRDQLNALDENPDPGFHSYDPERSPRPY